MAEHKRAVLIVNARSRRGQDWFEQTKETLQKDGIELVSSFAVKQADHVPELVKKAVGDKTRLVIVGGGDGTLGNIARYFVGSDSVLGVMPLGTGNQFARDLGIAVNVEEACRVITEGKVAAVDIGTVGDDYFLTVATIGLTTLIAEALTNDEKKRLGQFVYFKAVGQALRQMKRFHAKISTPEFAQSVETVQIVIGNGRFHAGPFPLAPDATITDGTLVVYALTASTRWDLLQFILHLPGGHHVALPTVPTFCTTGGIIETTVPQKVIVDGEEKLRTPLKFGIAPRALRVMVPQSFAG